MATVQTEPASWPQRAVVGGGAEWPYDPTVDPALFQLRNEKGGNNGYAGLDSNGKVPLGQLPPLSTDHVTGPWVTVEQYGAEGDGRIISDATITSGSSTLTSASGPFTSADVGKIIVILGAGTGSPTTGRGFTISGFTSATTVTLSTTAGTSVSSGLAAYGTDDSAAIQAALDSANAAQAGGRVLFDARMYMCGSRVTVPGGVMAVGAGMDYNGDDPFPARGTVLVAAGSLTTSVLRLGDLQYSGAITTAPFDSGHTMPQAHDMVLFGADIVADAISIIAARWKVNRLQLGGGNTSQANVPGQNGEMTGCIINGHSRGAGIINSGPDNSYMGNQIRGWKTIGFDGAGAHTQFSGNKIYPNNTEMIGATCAVRVSAIGYSIVDNVLGDSDMRGPHILLTGSSAKDCKIVANDFYHLAPAGMTAPAIRIDTSFAVLRGIHVVGNNVHGSNADDAGYATLVDVTGLNALESLNITGNTMSDVTTLYDLDDPATQAPAVCVGNVLRATRGGVTSTKVSEQRGRATLNGNGSATAFTIAHKIGSTPATVIVTPGSAVAAAPFHATANATDITVTFATAPASGTGNVILNWYVTKA